MKYEIMAIKALNFGFKPAFHFWFSLIFVRFDIDNVVLHSNKRINFLYLSTFLFKKPLAINAPS
tara:strand:+ start:151 stop:342 length:192 start_codon:yes stop_codon:yes gene_type:complete